VINIGTASAVIRAELRLAAGRTRSDPATLLRIADRADGGSLYMGTLSKVADGLYEEAWIPEADGNIQLSARYPAAALTSLNVPVLVDRNAPGFLIQVPSPPARLDGGGLNGIDPEPGYGAAWRRDEKVVVDVSSLSDDVNPSTVVLTALGHDGGAAAAPVTVAQKTVGCAKPYCGTATVDLSKPELKAFRGAFGLTVTGMDRAGNQGSGDGGVTVTRWKWVNAVTYGAWQARATPAVGTTGTVYFGTDAYSGTFYALNPDGTLKWTQTTGIVVGSPAVGVSDAGEDMIFVASTQAGGDGEIASLTSTGALLRSCPLPTGTSSTSSVAVADLSDAGESGPAGIAVFNGPILPNGSLISIHPTSSSGNWCNRTDIFQVDAPFPAAASTDGTDVFFGNGTAEVERYALSFGMWNSVPNWPVSVVSVGVRGPLAFVGAGLIGSGRGVFRIPMSSVSIAWRYPAGVTSQASSPSVGSGNYIYFGDQMPALTKVLMNATTAAATAPTVAPVNGAPAIGQDGTVYTVDSSGEFAAWTANLVKSWSVNGLGAVESSPNLDCARDAAGAKLAGRPGVLYVGSNTGKVYSFIVDSRGIDTTAPWPKYQHDPRNTGNSTTPMAEFVCPP
jgi:hypothetical protein